MKNKKADFNFTLLFAIVLGAAILILAIYGVMKISNTQRYTTDSEIAKKITIITDPLQAGFSQGKFGKITFKQETKINNICFDGGIGRQDISVSTKSGVGEDWQNPGAATSVYNKYIFSDEKEQGKEFYVFSKPFNFPYKISDLIFLTSKDYCFIEPPTEIEDEILDLGVINVKVSNNGIANCSSGAIRVCFGGVGDCDIKIYGSCVSNCKTSFDSGYVEKDGNRLDFIGNLMYAAIFSDSYVYDCNIKRLMYRTGKITEVLAGKADLMNSRGCNTNLWPDLVTYSGLTSNAKSSDLGNLNKLAQELDRKNNLELCRVW